MEITPQNCNSTKPTLEWGRTTIYMKRAREPAQNCDSISRFSLPTDRALPVIDVISYDIRGGRLLWLLGLQPDKTWQLDPPVRALQAFTRLCRPLSPGRLAPSANYQPSLGTFQVPRLTATLALSFNLMALPWHHAGMQRRDYWPLALDMKNTDRF